MKNNNNKYIVKVIDKKQIAGICSLKQLKKLIIAMLCVVLMSSCEKFVELDPPDTFLVGETVFDSDVNAESALVGIYGNMNDIGYTWMGSHSGLIVFSGMASDEFLNYWATESRVEFFDNSIAVQNSSNNSFWKKLYHLVYVTNSVLEGLKASENVSEDLALQLEGEARFLRALAYFYLVNLWGDVPLTLATDYQTNILLARTPASEVYAQIIEDLKQAGSLLPEEYVTEPFRTRVNKGAARAFLARVYLYTEDWNNAEAEATALIDDPAYELAEGLTEVFLVDSQEAIWQLENATSISPGFSFIFTRKPSQFSLREEVVQAFDTTDKRLDDWVGSLTITNPGDTVTYYYCHKYKIRFFSGPDIEFLTLMRLAEQYLIRAEARVKQGDIDGAKADLNMIRARAGLTDITTDDQASILMAIEQERSFELFAEGHRWLDLKRTGRSNTVLGAIKTFWDETDVLWPIPEWEILNNPNMTQNPGY